MAQVDSFRRVCQDTQFRAWLETERDQALKYLVAGTEAVVIHRAQGQIQLLEKMLDCMDKAKDLR